MVEQKSFQLSQVYKTRIEHRAKGYADTVSLKVRHGSGKTLVLWVETPGLPAWCVLRLHRQQHKVFYQIAKAAEEWLVAYKALYALPVVASTPVDSAVVDTAALLKKAASNIPPKKKSPRKGEHFRKREAFYTAAHFYSQGSAKNLFRADMDNAKAILQAEQHQ